jgi:DNA-binding NarL/FixJ family response regulator
MNKPVNVLLIHPQGLFAELVINALAKQPSIKLSGHIYSLDEAEPVNLEQPVDIVLIAADSQTGRSATLKTLRLIREVAPEAKPVVLLAKPDREQAIEAFECGARGVLVMQDSNFDHLCLCIDRVSAGQIWADNLHVSWIVDAIEQRSGQAPVRQSLFQTEVVATHLLTERETDVIELLAEGKTNREIAAGLGLSEHTVKNCLFRVFEKVGVSNRTELLAQTLGAGRSSHHSRDRYANRLEPEHALGTRTA